MRLRRKSADGLARHLPEIGWHEHVSLPDLNVHSLSAKIDTGAATSALQVREIASFGDDKTTGGKELVKITLTDAGADMTGWNTIVVPVERRVVVKISNGQREERPLIKTRIGLGPFQRVIPLTLTTNRGTLRFPMIVGRSAISGLFVVDVSKTYLLDK
jgi:hypothetical protein